jgi:hypothetical protein
MSKQKFYYIQDLDGGRAPCDTDFFIKKENAEKFIKEVLKIKYESLHFIVQEFTFEDEGEEETATTANSEAIGGRSV